MARLYLARLRRAWIGEMYRQARLASGLLATMASFMGLVSEQGRAPISPLIFLH